MFIFGFEAPSLCSLCNLEDETPFHLLFDSHIEKSLWTQLENCFSDDFKLFTLMPNTNLIGIFNDSLIAENASLMNHILLIIKLHVFKSRENHSLYLHYIIANRHTVKTFEKRIASVRDHKFTKIICHILLGPIFLCSFF